MIVVSSIGFVSTLIYLSWWLVDDRWLQPWPLVCLPLVLIWIAVQVWAAWIVYLRMTPTPSPPSPDGLDVDVFVPVFDEPAELVEKALLAARAIRYPHRTVLLDDSPGHRFEAMAERLGVDYRKRDEHHHAKAGNVNYALTASRAEFVAIFDLDHLAEPDFLDGVLGHFDDEAVGFVQRGIEFRNQHESWVARAAAEEAADPYGPTSQGMHGCNAAPLWGSHTTFRRAALDSIGGYSPGLAEDFHTSLRLHAAGWCSVFVPRAAASGLMPVDVLGMYKQRLKWARGVFEVLLHVLPRNIGRLEPLQLVTYLLRSTYYTIGAVFLAHCLAASRVLLADSGAARGAFSQYLLHALPMAVSFVLVRNAAMGFWTGRPAPRWLWRGYILTLFLWPAYVLALLASLLGLSIRHIPTPKRASDRQPFWLWLPPLILGSLLVVALVVRLVSGWTVSDVPTMLFVFAAAILQFVGIFFTTRNKPRLS